MISKEELVILRPFAFIQVNAKECFINSMGTVVNTNICYLDICFTFIQKQHFIFHGLAALAAIGPVTVESSALHSFRKTQPVGFVWTSVWPSQRSLPDNIKQSQETHIHVPGGIQIRNHRKRAAANPNLRPRGFRNLQKINLSTKT
jgi:hypothetical protein